MTTNLKIKKRLFLINNLEQTLDLLAYYKTHYAMIRDRDSLVLWKLDDLEGGVNLNEIT